MWLKRFPSLFHRIFFSYNFYTRKILENSRILVLFLEAFSRGFQMIVIHCLDHPYWIRLNFNMDSLNHSGNKMLSQRSIPKIYRIRVKTGSRNNRVGIRCIWHWIEENLLLSVSRFRSCIQCQMDSLRTWRNANQNKFSNRVWS